MAADTEAVAAACNDFDGRAARAVAFDAEAPENVEVRLDPRQEVQAHGGLVDFWYSDDGDILSIHGWYFHL